MATYTDNYQLTKPTYAEQADIGVINSNMNKIDNVMHSSQISLAPAYDQSQTYAEGDVVMYELLMYKCISPTTGVWDGSKWERTTASESGGGGSAELDILGEGNGAVVSFADGASAGLAKCIADINPVQDLHGYDKPWAGGAGKNLADKTTALSDDITITVGDDGKLTLNGTSTKAHYVRGLFNCADSTATYTWALFNSKAYSSGVEFSIRNADASSAGGWARVNAVNKTVTFTPDGNPTLWQIQINSGVTFNNDVIFPMIVSGSVAPTTFEPYSNICPISGSTSVTVTISDGETSTTKTTPLGQTVYGGQLNVLTGELTIDRGFITITSESQLTTFTYNAENGSFSQVASDGKISNAEVMCISNMVEGISFNNRVARAYVDKDRCYSDETGKIRIRNRSSVTINTKADLFARFEGAEICYFLATPQTVQLTPQEVNSLLGQNNISADTGDIDIVYVKASAPIQPNPTGTPTATLKKLGIEGTVFELEGGGGGDSMEHITTDGVPRVIGTYDGKTLYEATYRFTSGFAAGNNTFPFNLADATIRDCNVVQITNDNPPVTAIGLGNTDIRLVNVSTDRAFVYISQSNVPYINYIDITIKYTKLTD